MTQQYPELNRLLIKIGKEVQSEYRKNLKQKKKFATGKLYESINYRIEIKGSKITLYFVSEKYYINIENGRKAGSKMPPVGIIQRWMQIKGIKPKKGYSKSGAAYVIAKSISTKGIKANPFLRNIKKDLSDYIDDIKIALQKDLQVDVKIIVNKIKNLKGNKHIKINSK